MKEKIILLITGQKKRLELSSKIEKIIEPLSKIYDITVILSLSETNNFTNKHKYKKNFKYDKYNIENELNSFSYHINEIVYPKLNINDEILKMYDKQCNGKEFTISRAKNHIRQYYTLSNSWSIVEKFNPDLLIRIRDDATLLDLIDLNKILQLSTTNLISSSKYSKKSIITSRYESWGGINDKFAIVLKEAIKPYLEEPLKIYNSYKRNVLTGKFSNPEQFIKKVYLKSDILLHTTDIIISIIGQTLPDEIVKKI